MVGLKLTVIGRGVGASFGAGIGIGGGANKTSMISSQGTDCDMPFSVKSTDSGPIFTMSPVRTGPDFDLIQICLADFCSGDFLSALFCAGEQMLARNRTERDITIMFTRS